jgi:hypothetical protein
MVTRATCRTEGDNEQLARNKQRKKEKFSIPIGMQVDQYIGRRGPLCCLLLVVFYAIIYC